MAKDNLFLGFARGAVGDVVFTRSGGTQVSRARNRAPLNPQTVLQALQRVFFKHCSLAYKVLAPICDHSFESAKTKSENYDQFMRANLADCKSAVQYLIDRADYDAILASDLKAYPLRSDDKTFLGDFIISQGSCPGVELFPGAYYIYLRGELAEGASTLTYRQVADRYGLRRGDQLTFVFVRYIASSSLGYLQMTGCDYARIILDPSDGDMDSLFATDGAWRYPDNANAKNLGRAYFKLIDDRLAVAPTFEEDAEWAEGVNAVGAIGCIVSRLINGRWARSNAYLRVFPTLTRGPLGLAVQSFMQSSQSSQYLNHASV